MGGFQQPGDVEPWGAHAGYPLVRLVLLWSTSPKAEPELGLTRGFTDVSVHKLETVRVIEATT